MKQFPDEHPKKPLKASHIYRDLRDLVWPRRNLFLLGLVLVFINRAAGLVLPGTTKFLIDDVAQKHRQELLIPLVAAVGLAVVVQAITSYTLIQLLSTSAQRLIAEMRIRVQQHVGRLTESLGGVRIVKGFHAEQREAAVFEAGAMRLFENVRKTLFATSVIGLTSTLLMGIVSITVMVVGGRLILGGRMTIGDFVAFSLYLGFMVAPVFQMVSIGTQITEAFAGLDRMHEVMAEQPEDVDAERIIKLDRIRGHIEFENVTFEYEAGKPVLRGITLDAVPGAVTALIGSSGSGKSTLIGLVAAFAKPTTGGVSVD